MLYLMKQFPNKFSVKLEFHCSQIEQFCYFNFNIALTNIYEECIFRNTENKVIEFWHSNRVGIQKIIAAEVGSLKLAQDFWISV